jgi:hypothetical protein
MSTKELLYRIEKKHAPEAGEEEKEFNDLEEKKIDRLQEGDEEVAGNFEMEGTADSLELENVAEL